MPSIFLDAILFGSFIHPDGKRRTYDAASRVHTLQALVISKPLMGHIGPRFPNEFIGMKKQLTMKFFRLFENFVPFQFHFCTKMDLLYDDYGEEVKPVTDAEKRYFADKTIEKKSRIFFISRFFQLKYFHISYHREMNSCLEEHDFEILGSSNLCPMIDLEELSFEHCGGSRDPKTLTNFEAHRALKKLNVGDFWRALKPENLCETLSRLPVVLRSLECQLGNCLRTEKCLEVFALLPECLEELNLTGAFGSFQFSPEPGDDAYGYSDDETEYNDGILNRTFCPEKTPFLIKHLKVLKMGYNDDLPAREVTFLKHFTNLEDIDLRESIKLAKPEFFRDTLSHCKKLKSIALDYTSSLNDDCLKEIAENLPNLEKLTFDGCHGRFTEVGIAHLEKLHKTLRILDLRGVHLPNDECMKSIGKLDVLEELHLRDSLDISGESIQFLADNKSLAEHLQVLDLAQCTKINFFSAQVIGDNFKNLHTLKLTYTSVGDKGFDYIVSKLGEQINVFEAIGSQVNHFSRRGYLGLCDYNQEKTRSY